MEENNNRLTMNSITLHDKIFQQYISKDEIINKAAIIAVKAKVDSTDKSKFPVINV